MADKDKAKRHQELREKDKAKRGVVSYPKNTDSKNNDKSKENHSRKDKGMFNK